MFDRPYALGHKTIQGRFLVPSGIRCTHAATIRKTFLEVPSIGVITTKSISAQPRPGYREPIYARYAPGCYINAVGLANPGARQFLAEFDGIEIPADKFLLVSIFGSDIESFVEAALVLKPLADGFELNMSCPHAKGYGAQVGQDTELLSRITAAVVQAVDVPVFVKLSASFADVEATSRASIAAGAAGLTVTNTIGPAVVSVGRDPVLHNKFGGLSGDGIRPLGLRAVEQVRKAVGPEPVIIGMGGIASPEHVGQYQLAGANLFGVGSALTGLDSSQFREYMARLQDDMCQGRAASVYSRSCESSLCMDYVRTRIAARHQLDDCLFKLILEDLPSQYNDGDLAGKFLFLCVPNVGEKPFAVFSCSEKSVVVRVVGEFTRSLAELPVGAEILLRGPYGCGVPSFENSTLVFVGGGTGTASLLEIAHKLRPGNKQLFLLGGRSREHLFDIDRFEQLGAVHLATDDGTAGFHGYVPDLLQDVVAQLPPADRQQIAFINCGPERMIWRCFEIEKEMAPEHRIVGAIEYITSCGVGICGKCSSPSGALTCIDGPFMQWQDFQSRAMRQATHA
jgi:dihydroorotate dehydrogenase subfamily 1